MKIKNDAFTLIELLAVIVILAIIALIATPIILGIINDSKKSAAELSVKNYIRAVELAVMNEDISSNINLAKRIEFEIINEKQIYSNNNTEDTSDDITIDIEYDGNVLTAGIITIENGTVVQITAGKIDGWIVTFFEGKIELDKETKESEKEEEEIQKSTLILGETFNTKIKQLANDPTFNYESEDFNITTIEFYSNGKLPEGYTKEELESFNSVDISIEGEEGSIIAYYNNGKVYICSNNLINFNENTSKMFYKLRSVTSILFGIIDTSQTTNMKGMFSGCKALTSLDVSKFNTSNVTNMHGMFDSCTNLEQLNLINFNTSNVTTMSYMFYNCNNLESLNINDFNTGQVTSMVQMFYGCNSLTSLDLSSFNTSNVTTMKEMFRRCSSLTSLDLSNFKTTNVSGDGMAQMFTGCSGLITLNISNFNTSNVTNMHGMFDSCKALTSLNISSFNTKNVVKMQSMFYGTQNLESITVGCDWVTATNTTTMFTGSTFTLDQFNTLVQETQESCPAN